MLGQAQRHFVERALDRYQDTLIDWFPSCFHWSRFCADAPSMAARIAGRPEDEPDLGLEHAIAGRAEVVFSFSYVTTLAVLATSSATEGDPGEALATLVDEPEDAEEAYMEGLVGEVLEPLERMLGGDEDIPELDERGEAAYALLFVAWPAVEELLQEDGILGEDESPMPGEDGAHRVAVRSVMGSIALVGAILAVFRWMSVGQTAADDAS